MNLENKLALQIAEIAQKYPNISKVVLFGSRARGDNKNTSDIDLAVYASENISEFNYDIEVLLPTLLTFDITHVDETLDPVFLENIISEGACLYEQSKI